MTFYKIFNSDFTWQDTKFEVGKDYEISEDADASVFGKGFLFWSNAIDCFRINPQSVTQTRIAEVAPLGVVHSFVGSCAFSTDKIRILRELSAEEISHILNSGDGNTGAGNSGHYNQGNWNSGFRNMGLSNSGSHNTGCWNSGSYNKGDKNSGWQCNGAGNSGYNNDGHSNSGFCNVGSFNSGRANLGSYNTGFCNRGSYISGCFNTKQTMFIFNKDTGLTFDEFIDKFPAHFDLLTRIHLNITSWDSENEELTVSHYENAWKNWWSELDNRSKDLIKTLPNFDSGIFREITGIEIQ